MRVAPDTRRRNQYVAAELRGVRLTAAEILSFIEAIYKARILRRCMGGGCIDLIAKSPHAHRDQWT
jgi:hypothetical protein